MKKTVLRIVAMLCILLAAAAFAEGFLPAGENVYGEDMPALGKVFLRDPDITETLPDGGIRLTFQNVSEAEFDEFSIYLGYFGCSLTDFGIEDTLVDATVEKNGHTFGFTYDYATGTAVLTYPAGTEEVPSDAAERAAYIARFDAGKTVSFGTYAGEPIEWLVLEAKGDERVLISVKGLEARPYNEKWEDLTWETCTLRKWLNGEFYDTAFSPEEQAQIVTAKVTADKNPDYSTEPGRDTEDKVWLLSITEVNRYFANDTARRCAPTTHAVKDGAHQYRKYTVDGTGACWWWLRSPGYYSSDAAGVNSDGSVDSFGRYVLRDDACVRPAIVLRLS